MLVQSADGRPVFEPRLLSTTRALHLIWARSATAQVALDHIEHAMPDDEGTKWRRVAAPPTGGQFSNLRGTNDSCDRLAVSFETRDAASRRVLVATWTSAGWTKPTSIAPPHVTISRGADITDMGGDFLVVWNALEWTHGAPVGSGTHVTRLPFRD